MYHLFSFPRSSFISILAIIRSFKGCKSYLEFPVAIFPSLLPTKMHHLHAVARHLNMHPWLMIVRNMFSSSSMHLPPASSLSSQSVVAMQRWAKENPSCTSATMPPNEIFYCPDFYAVYTIWNRCVIWDRACL